MAMEQRIAVLEQKVDSWLALDARLKAIEDSIKKLGPKSSVRDWISTLSPFIVAVTVFAIGYIYKDSVVQALEREKLDLSYVVSMRDLIKSLDEAKDQSSAYSNAVALAMFGRFSLVPLIDRLHGDDNSQLAAERGLRIVGSADPASACAAFTNVLLDPARQYMWQTHKAVVRLMGASDCVPGIPVLESYLAELGTLGDPELLKKFVKRYSNDDAFDGENVEPFKQDVLAALEILKASRDRADRGEKAWWK